MDTQIILVYCLCGELLRAMQYQEDGQCQIRDEVFAGRLPILVAY